MDNPSGSPRPLASIEQVLRPLVYGEPTRLKQDVAVKSAVLSILEAMVEGGSSAVT